MAALPALGPAVAQPIAFTSEYLRWGASCFPSDCLGDKAARGIYSFGAIVVAPVGMFYHISMAAFGAIARCIKADANEKKELSTWAWQHFYASVNDALALHTALIVPLFITSFVAFSHFVACKEALLAFVYFVGVVIYMLMLDVSMPYHYTMNPEFYRAFDASQRLAGDKPLWESCVFITNALLLLLQLIRSLYL